MPGCYANRWFIGQKVPYVTSSLARIHGCATALCQTEFSLHFWLVNVLCQELKLGRPGNVDRGPYCEFFCQKGVDMFMNVMCLTYMHKRITEKIGAFTVRMLYLLFQNV